MAVRSFNGSTDYLNTATGAASGMTYGTVACIINVPDTAHAQAVAAMHDSGGTFLWNPLYVTNNEAAAWYDGSAESALGTAVTTSVWYLIVVRKVTGSAAPRFSQYNFNTTTWTHGVGGATLGNSTAPGASGTIQFTFQSATDDQLAGLVAARAVWSNTLPWAADASGDTAIQSAGLHTAAANWLSNNPSAFWLFNQASTATAVDDVSTTGTADQVAISGTSVVTGNDPPGFDFTLTSVAPPAVSLQLWPQRIGPWPRPQVLPPPPPSTIPATNASADVATGTGTAFFDTSGGSISLNLVADNPVTATGTAYDATISTANATNAAAQLASATGTANGPTSRVSPTTTVAAGTGTANSATSIISPGAATATGNGAAQPAVGTVSPGASLASATGTAFNATANTGSSTSANAGNALGTGTAYDPTSAVAPGAGAAAGTGAALQPNVTVAGSASTAAAAGTANNATSKVSPAAGLAAATGAAFNATVQTGSFTNALAGLAAAIGTANGAIGKVSPTTGAATGTATAFNASAGSAVSVNAGVATASGTAYNPGVARGALAQAGVASAAGTVPAANLKVLVSAGAAVGVGSAFDAVTPPSITPRPNSGRAIRPNTGTTHRP